MKKFNKILLFLFFVIFGYFFLTDVNSIKAEQLIHAMNVETPVINAQFKPNDRSIFLSGWAIDSLGIKDINVYLNETLIGKANKGVSRPDVKSVFPQVAGSDTSGFNFDIDISKLVAGTNNIKVEVVSNNNYVQKSELHVTLIDLVPITVIDTPVVNGTINNSNLYISGWAINKSSVKQVKVYLDNTYIGDANVGTTRLDVSDLFKDYLNSSKSGFNFTISKNSISSGKHTIAVEAIGVNNTTSGKISREINIVKPTPIINIETPIVNCTINNDNIYVSGWAILPSGINEAKVYLNGTYKGIALTGLDRPDVQAAFPQYDFSKQSGFNYTLNRNDVPKGNNQITIEFKGNDNSIVKYTININMNKPSPILAVEYPSSGSTFNSSEMFISGWHLNTSGTREVNILIDQQPVGKASIGIYRNDVGNTFPNYHIDNSGYSISVDISKFSVGTHTLVVQAIGNDSAIVTQQLSFVMNGTATYIQYNNTLDYYVNLEYNNNGNTNWDGTPVTKEDIRYYMNPNNFINNPVAKYMFLKLSYTEGTSVSDLNKILQGKGILSGTGEIFLRAAKEANINPIYLVSHALLETGNGTSRLASGQLRVNAIYRRVISSDGTVQAILDRNVEEKAIYNFFGIGAYDDNPDFWGKNEAYKNGWFTVEDAIIGGAKWIAKGYIDSPTYKQDTLYKMKWNLVPDKMWHQYATDIGWAYKQTGRIKELIDMMDKPVLYFDIPKFLEDLYK